ncbi:SGS-domain-containing protein [Ramaria rubella]|nr:SGS-domain-containing protein [Ramaria rubella]
MSIQPRHEFYETDERVTISVFDKGANPDGVSVKFSPRALNYTNGEKQLVLDPLTGEIDPEASGYTVGKVKIEVRLAKKAPGRWVRLVRDPESEVDPTPSGAAPGSNSSTVRKPPKKNWESLSDNILKAEKDKSMSEDPNAVDSNRAFADLFANVDEDAKRAIMKSYTESGGTTLSTDWSDVSKGPVTVKPPEGQEWRKWG